MRRSCGMPRSIRTCAARTLDRCFYQPSSTFQGANAMRLSWYRGFFRIWVVFSGLWMAAMAYEISTEYSTHRAWQVEHDAWKRQYAKWEKTPPVKYPDCEKSSDQF